jgi:hypothetical protein
VFAVGEQLPPHTERFIGTDAATLIGHDSLAVLRGDTSAITAELQRRRDLFGISYIAVNSEFAEQTRTNRRGTHRQLSLSRRSARLESLRSAADAPRLMGCVTRWPGRPRAARHPSQTRVEPDRDLCGGGARAGRGAWLRPGRPGGAGG